jgi:hypothetical protein
MNASAKRSFRAQGGIVRGHAMRRLLLTIPVVLLALLVGAPSASAGAPERYTDSFVFSDTIDCSQFNPEWQFNDNFTDFFEVRGQQFVDDAGNVISFIEHVQHRSNDMNSVTGFTLHEHNHFVVQGDLVAGTISLSGAINIMQRRAAGEVIQNVGHKVFDLETGDPLQLSGPNKAGDEDFCRAVAPSPSRP